MRDHQAVADWPTGAGRPPQNHAKRPLFALKKRAPFAEIILNPSVLVNSRVPLSPPWPVENSEPVRHCPQVNEWSYCVFNYHGKIFVAWKFHVLIKWRTVSCTRGTWTRGYTNAWLPCSALWFARQFVVLLKLSVIEKRGEERMSEWASFSQAGR